VESINTTTGLIIVKGTFNTKKIVLDSSINLGINTNSTGTNPLSNYTTSSYANTLNVSPTDLSTFVNNLVLSTIYIPAEEDAVYNIFVIKN
jgi:hypothetical protein